jgi:hypothetical protein
LHIHYQWNHNASKPQTIVGRSSPTLGARP